MYISPIFLYSHSDMGPPPRVLAHCYIVRLVDKDMHLRYIWVNVGVNELLTGYTLRPLSTSFIKTKKLARVKKCTLAKYDANN